MCECTADSASQRSLTSKKSSNGQLFLDCDKLCDVAGYFEAPGAPVYGLGHIAGAMPAINLLPVTMTFCNMDNFTRMKVSSIMTCCRWLLSHRSCMTLHSPDILNLKSRDPNPAAVLDSHSSCSGVHRGYCEPSASAEL